MRYRIILEAQPEGGYTVFVPELPDVITEGETEEEAITNVKDAIVGYLGVLKEMGWTKPVVKEQVVEVSI